MMNRMEICTPLRKFFRYLMACPTVPQPVTLEVAKEELEQLPTYRLELLLGGLKPGQVAGEIENMMEQDLAILLSMNPAPVLVEELLAHHFLIQDATRN